MEFTVSTTDRTEVLDVTAEVEDAVPDDVESGTCTVYVRHTTAGVVVNEAERGLIEDVEAFLEQLAPWGAGYQHDAIDDNAAAHLRAMLVGESVTVPVEDGSLALGTWQSILFVECDGPRTRHVRVVVTES